MCKAHEICCKQCRACSLTPIKQLWANHCEWIRVQKAAYFLAT